MDSAGIQTVAPVGAGLCLLLHAASLAWRDERVRADRAEAELKALRDAAPRVCFDQVKHAPITLTVEGGETLTMWEVWFKNRPVVQGVDAIAQQLTADVEVCDSNWQCLFRFVGQWLLSREPEHAGWIARASQIDLPPVNTWGKLLLIGETDTTTSHWGQPDATGERELVEERDVFALAGENLHHAPQTANHPHYQLGPQAVRIRVTLVAINMSEHVFLFSLRRHRNGSVISIEPVTP